MLALKSLVVVYFALDLLSFALTEENIRSTKIGDIIIKIENDKLYCDQIICSIADGEVCLVTKVQDRKDHSILIRSNFCRLDNGKDQMTSITHHEVNPNSKIRVIIRAYANGLIESNYLKHENDKTFKEKRVFNI